MIASTFGDGQVAYSILWFFLFFIEVWLAISIFIDIFRSHDLAGWAKAAWVIFVIVLPLIGILAYFIFRGDKMRAHQIQASQDFTGRPSTADEISKLVDLKNSGEITEAEFERLKAHVISEAADAGSRPGDS
jgi:uncharacterized membrane protein